VRRALAHFGVLEPEPDDAPRDPGPLLELAGPPAYVYAADEGAFEPLHPLGAHVSAGEPVGRIHCLSDPSRPPQTLVAGTDGLVYGRRHPGLVRPGNCCLVVASPWRGA
jgi:predicted deacylase